MGEGEREKRKEGALKGESSTFRRKSADDPTDCCLPRRESRLERNLVLKAICLEGTDFRDFGDKCFVFDLERITRVIVKVWWPVTKAAGEGNES